MAASQTGSANKSDNTTQSVKAKPNRALFEQLRSKKAQSGNVKTESKSTSEAEEIEFMAELMFPSAAPALPTAPPPPSPLLKIHRSDQALPRQDRGLPDCTGAGIDQAAGPETDELASYKYKLDDLSSASKRCGRCATTYGRSLEREKTHRIQVEQLDHKIGLFTVWAEEVQRSWASRRRLSLLRSASLSSGVRSRRFVA